MVKKTPLHKQFLVLFISLFLLVSFCSVAQVGIATTTPLSTFEVNGSFGQTITTVSSDLTLDATHNIILCNNGAIPKTITLPTAIGIKGRIYIIKRSESSTETITIATTALQSIDGQQNIYLTQAKEAISLISDGSTWNIIGNHLPKQPLGEINFFNTTGSAVNINSSTIDGSSDMFLCNPVASLSTNSIDFISSGNSGLQYKGTSTRTFKITATITASTNSPGSFIYEFKKNNSTYFPSSRVIQNLNSDVQNTTIQATVTLAPNDYIELWVGKISSTANVIIQSLNLIAIGL
jgi:hypothetical protein